MIASIKDGIIVALARLLFEYLLLAGQFAGPYYLCILKQSNNSPVWACLGMRPTYLAGETWWEGHDLIFLLAASKKKLTL